MEYWSIYSDETRLSKGIVRDCNLEIIKFFDSIGFSIKHGVNIFNSKEISLIKEKYVEFAKLEIERYYEKNIEDADLRGWTDFEFEGDVYKLYVHTESKKRLQCIFVIYKALFLENPQIFKIVISEELG